MTVDKKLIEPYFLEFIKKSGLNKNDIDVDFFISILEVEKDESTLQKVRNGIDALTYEIDRMIANKKTDLDIIEHIINHASDLKDQYLTIIGRERKSLDVLFREALERACVDRPEGFISGHQVTGPFKALVDNLDGFNPGHYLFVAAPHVGKTTTMIELINGLLSNNSSSATAHFVSADDDTKKIIKTMVAFHSRMGRNEVDRNIHKSLKMNHIAASYKFFIEAYKRKLLDIRWDIENWNDFEYYVIETLKQHKNPVFFIDGPSNISIKEKIYDRDEKMNYIPNFIHKICGRYNVPIVLTYELTKANFQKPRMEDVKGGGKWVYNASGIMLMYQHPDYYGDNPKKELPDNSAVVRIDCVKNKNSEWLGYYDMMLIKNKSIFRRIDEYSEI